MSDTDKITQAEMVKMFGDSMPMEAVHLLYNADAEKTVGELRAELRRLAGTPARWRAREVIRKLCTDPEVWATHGMPGDHKLRRLEDEITAAIEAAQTV